MGNLPMSFRSAPVADDTGKVARATFPRSDRPQPCVTLRSERIMAYLPIEDYGLIGNMHTAALVGKDGSIDWLCLPHFDSPSVFAALLDERKGGRFRIAPVAAEGVARKQLYWPDTNCLITRFLLS